MKRKIILILTLLTLTVTVGAGLAFDDKQRNTSRNDGKLHKTGNNIRSAVEIALDKAGKAIEKAENKTAQTLGIAIDKTNQALEKAGKKIQDWFDDKPNVSKQKKSP